MTCKKYKTENSFMLKCFRITEYHRKVASLHSQNTEHYRWINHLSWRFCVNVKKITALYLKYLNRNRNTVHFVHNADIWCPSLSHINTLIQEVVTYSRDDDWPRSGNIISCSLSLSWADMTGAHNQIYSLICQTDKGHKKVEIKSHFNKLVSVWIKQTQCNMSISKLFIFLN